MKHCLSLISWEGLVTCGNSTPLAVVVRPALGIRIRTKMVDVIAIDDSTVAAIFKLSIKRCWRSLIQKACQNNTQNPY